MSKEKYNHIIDDAYDNYLKKKTTSNKDRIREPHTLSNGMTGQISRPYLKEEFINKCKTDSEFSEKWGLKIEEREFKYWERRRYRAKLVMEGKIPFGSLIGDCDFKDLDYYNIPTKLITITHNNETIEVYE